MRLLKTRRGDAERARSSMTLIGALCSVALLASSQPARAETPGEKVIRLMDEAMTRATDQYFEQEVTTQEPGKAPTKLSMKVNIKGKSWRLIEFVAPGDIKGMKALVLSLTQMYVYLPAFHKVRRVASHARSQSFMGTALSQDDTSITTYGETYEGKLLSESKTSWTVEGTRRPGKDFPYAKMVFVISKQFHAPTEILYYNEKGTKLKTEKRSSYECVGNICAPVVIKMTDHTRGGIWTEIRSVVRKVNTGIPDSAFTPRALQRGQ